MRINTNVPALTSYNALNATNSSLQKSINRLSTGLRINSAADDAAGLAISEKMRAQYRGLDQATSNAQDGISMIQTAEGALNETHSILQRMRELSVQAANDTLTQEDRSYIQLEVDQLKEEITRISTTTQFNKKQLLDGSAAAVWSSDNLETKAIINGGLRSIDQFGQKVTTEGNYKITIKATPGEAQIQKSDIFKIKHDNVIMNVHKDEQKGVASIRVDSLPAGNYNVRLMSSIASATSALGNTITNRNGAVVAAYGATTALAAQVFHVSSIRTVNATGGGAGLVNVSYMIEVVGRNTGANQVTFNIQAIGLTQSGASITYNGGEFIASTGLMVVGTVRSDLGMEFRTTTAIQLTTIAGGAGANAFNVGDKIVLTKLATGGTAGDMAHVLITGNVNTGWDNAWADATLGNAYTINAANVQNKEVHFKQFYLNTANGTVHQGDVAITFNDNIKAHAAAANGTVATFEAAYVGQIAKGDVALRDLDKFWDANGKFMLDDPKTLQVVQGDGKSASVTLYSTDTIEDVRSKLNDAIAVGLGQGKYVNNSIDNFVTFVEQGKTVANTSESVAGTMVVRSLVPGAAGTISLSGDEDVVKAFSLNVIQNAKESKYEATITDAHSGNTVVSGAKVTGNKLVGVLHPNVDVTFDSMANTAVKYDDASKRFVLSRDSKVYETVVHLSDNTTVFQIGANQGEDMGINIGNMSSEALGVSNINVMSREGASSAITTIDNAINKVSKQRAVLGAYQNRLEHTINNLTTASTNLKSAESRIRDADMAKEMMNFTKLNILSSAGNSMLAQANQLPQNVLSLLR